MARYTRPSYNTADVFATVLELFGYTTWQTQIPTAKPVDSKSILPIIKNQTTQVRPWAFTEIFKLNTLYIIIKRFKLSRSELNL